MIVFPFMVQEELITSSFHKILGWSILIQLIAKFFMDDSLADTRVSQKKQKSEFCFATKPTDFHRLDEPPEKISAL